MSWKLSGSASTDSALYSREGTSTIYIMKYLVSRWPCSWKLQLGECIFYEAVSSGQPGEIPDLRSIWLQHYPGDLPGCRQRCVERRGIHLRLLCLAIYTATCWDMSELTSVSISVSASFCIQVIHPSISNFMYHLDHSMRSIRQRSASVLSLQSTSTFPSELHQIIRIHQHLIYLYIYLQ